jgi:hypothetical protein
MKIVAYGTEIKNIHSPIGRLISFIVPANSAEKDQCPISVTITSQTIKKPLTAIILKNKAGHLRQNPTFLSKDKTSGPNITRKFNQKYNDITFHHNRLFDIN